MERWTVLDGSRFQEIDTEDELLSGRRNITSDPNFSKISSRSASYDDYILQKLGYSGHSSEEHLAYGDRYGSSEGEEEEEDFVVPSRQLVARNNDETLYQNAQDRIRRAKAQGRATVNLTHEELEALERRSFKDSKESTERRKPSPKGKSSPNRQGVWTRPRSTSRSGLLTAALVPAKQRSSRRPSKKDSPPIDDYRTSAAVNQPGFMGSGISKEPYYPPIGHHNAQLSSRKRDSERPSPPARSNSGSHASSNRYPSDQIPNYFTQRTQGSRSPSLYSDASPPYPSDPQAYGGAYAYPHPPGVVTGRRVVSGPESAYPGVYRRPIPSAVPGRIPPSTSDPSISYTRADRASERSAEPRGRRDEDSTSDTDDEEEGQEQIEYIERRRSSGVRREPPQQSWPESRRRRSKR